MASNEQKTVTDDEAGMRLDTWLATHSSAGSRKRARDALSTGKVSVSGQRVGPAAGGRPVVAGSVVAIAWSNPKMAMPSPAAMQRLQKSGVRVLHLDDTMVVANKPAGMLTDTATAAQRRDRDSLRKQLRAWLGAKVWPAHRIDRDTTGVVAFARTEHLQGELRAQWHARTPERVYLVLVEGQVVGDRGRWADWMAWDSEAKLQQPAREGGPKAVLAEADWLVTARSRKATALEVRLVSGRRNQIRLQAKLRGTPLIGETQYRDGESDIRARRQALHAYRLVLDHPTTRERITFEAPIPEDLRRLYRSLELRKP